MKTHTEKQILKCDACSFSTDTQSLLGNHIISAHTSKFIPSQTPDPIQPTCDQCRFSPKDEDDLKQHKLTSHQDASDQVKFDETYVQNILIENLKLKKELSNLKDDFVRLNDIFELSKNTSKTDPRDDETENECLKEKNDTLFKLGPY